MNLICTTLELKPKKMQLLVSLTILAISIIVTYQVASKRATRKCYGSLMPANRFAKTFPNRRFDVRSIVEESISAGHLIRIRFDRERDDRFMRATGFHPVAGEHYRFDKRRKQFVRC
jgi:hypothetical protein